VEDATTLSWSSAAVSEWVIRRIRRTFICIRRHFELELTSCLP